MQVQVTKSHLDKFRRKCRASRTEMFALLVGKRLSSTKIIVTRFDYPLMFFSSPCYADPEKESYAQIFVKAKEDGLRVLGSIHSHLDWLPIMSPTDIRTHKASKDLISGIVEVTNGRTRVVFWQDNSCLPCDFTYT